MRNCGAAACWRDPKFERLVPQPASAFTGIFTLEAARSIVAGNDADDAQVVAAVVSAAYCSEPGRSRWGTSTILRGFGALVSFRPVCPFPNSHDAVDQGADIDQMRPLLGCQLCIHSLAGVYAKLADRAKADALYLTGYGAVASYLELPDAAQTVHKPSIAHGGLLNIHHIIRGYMKRPARLRSNQEQRLTGM